jgi:hypothetical protein
MSSPQLENLVRIPQLKEGSPVRAEIDGLRSILGRREMAA